jgi:hypothetical protein
MNDLIRNKNSISDYTEDQFITLIRELDGAATERKRNMLVGHFNKVVPHPAGSDLLYFPEPGADYSDEGVVRTIREWCSANGLPGFKPADPTCTPQKQESPGKMDIQEIQQLLIKPVTKFTTNRSSIVPHNEESWIGKVFLFRADEEVPRNEAGVELYPYAQFYLPSLPFNSPLLEGISVLTLFVADPLPGELEPMGNNWLIREYKAEDVLVYKDLPVAGSTIKPSRLNAELVADDFPLWDGGGIPGYLAAEICELEDAGKLESFDDLGRHIYDHKVGGYPSFCQPGIDLGDDFEFVLQLSSDADINLNIVDCGSLMFWKHRHSGEWVMYYDFY